MKKIITLLFLLAPLAAICQNLTGTWEGSGGGTTYIRMVIKHRGDSLFGYTYDEGSGYCKAWFLGRYSKSGKRLIGRGTEMIEHTSNHVLVDYDLIYSKEEDGEYLRENLGEASFLSRILGSNNRQYLKKTSNKISLPGKPSVKAKPPVVPRPPVTTITEKKPAPEVVKKEPVKKVPVPVTKPVVKKPVTTQPPVVVKPVEKKIPARTDTVVKVIAVKKPEYKPAPAALLKQKDERASKLVQTIYTSADSIRINVYDNGEVDGDTVTVFFDNSVILDKYRISEKAKEISLPVRKGEQHTIELFANNLGSIPPNTALIIIMADNKRYELRASYDFRTNAKIIIQYKE